MVIKETAQVGSKVIRAKAKKVLDVKAKNVQKVLRDLIDSMRHYGLVGMAAPQIGESIQMFVTEVRKTKFRKDLKILESLRIFINPKILSFSKKQVKDWEGCGSVASAGLFGMVARPVSVAVEALNEKGEKFHLKASGLLARIIQHEVGHLNGIVFTDKADTKTYMSRDEYLKLREKGARNRKLV